MSLYEIKLEKDELLSLDGKVNEKAQSLIDRIKRIDIVSQGKNLDEPSAAFLVDVLDVVEKERRIIHRHCGVAKCRICKAGAIPIPYKSGPRKGEAKDYRNLAGVELADSFISMKGYPKLGACRSCVDRLMPTIIEAIEGLEVEVCVPGATKKFVRSRNRKCTKCGWEGCENQMTQERTMMGDGYYPCGCPSCGARNTWGSDPVAIIDGYTMVPFAEAVKWTR